VCGLLWGKEGVVAVCGGSVSRVRQGEERWRCVCVPAAVWAGRYGVVVVAGGHVWWWCSGAGGGGVCGAKVWWCSVAGVRLGWDHKEGTAVT